MNMYNPKKILVPVDFSEISEGVVRASAEIAKKWDSEILILHVAQETDHLPTIPAPSHRELGEKHGLVLPSRSQLLENAQLELEGRLEVMARTAADGLKVRTVVVWGSPVEQIVRTAGAGDCDLIVMATHGRGGLSRFLLGSVTEQVIRRAPCPVLAIRAKVARERLAAAGTERALAG